VFDSLLLWVIGHAGLLALIVYRHTFLGEDFNYFWVFFSVKAQSRTKAYINIILVRDRVLRERVLRLLPFIILQLEVVFFCGACSGEFFPYALYGCL